MRDAFFFLELIKNLNKQACILNQLSQQNLFPHEVVVVIAILIKNEGDGGHQVKVKSFPIQTRKLF